MYLDTRQIIRTITVSALAALFILPQDIAAQVSDHVVSSSDLEKATVDASRVRQQNLETLNSFFSSAKAQKALESAQVDPQQVKVAVASLSDVELAQLAAKANTAQGDFAAGNIDNRDLLIILVGIALLILIIVAVH